MEIPFPFYTEVNMSTFSCDSNALTLFAQSLKKVPDPRSKQGTTHPCSTLLAVVLLGLLAKVATPAEIARWTERNFTKLSKFLRFGKRKGELPSPCDNTFTRVLKKLSLADLQNAFAEFVNALLQDTTLVAAVDGKVAKQMKDANGDPILMINIFAQNLKLHLASWSVHGDKTNEPACLRKHLEELFTMYPFLKLLTGDAIYSQRPLLEALQEYERDYLFQVKENQPKVLKKMKEVFKDVELEEPDDTREIVGDAPPEKKSPKLHDRKVAKKRGLLRSVVCG
jgi:hypothetical protein